ncbi:hypothetical protein FNF31_06158 [Cafeteria roenbergensis]|uniref:Ion transport domain-containing protein n=1 Tax=Cafeteria roenbergensis TaxID=33653 RepID=A0A5A8CSD4_CAFRO|nr:hypothetical protein FNF31_06158 [Cafeteria roenbergensis]
MAVSDLVAASPRPGTQGPASYTASAAPAALATPASRVGVRGDYILTLERDYDVYFDKERPAWRAEASADSDDDEDKEEPTAKGAQGKAGSRSAGSGAEDGSGHQTNLELMMALPQQLRRTLYSAVKNPWFDRVVLFLVVVNCVVLALDTPNLDVNSALGQGVAVANVVFVVLFTLEALIKLFALGAIAHEDSYFRSPWNWLDFAIVLEGLVSTFVGGNGSLSGLRAFRVLRPLKTVSRLEGLKVIVNALLASMPLLFNTMIVVSFYFLVFGIIGVQVWSGQFHDRCFMLETGLLDYEDERLCADDGSGDHSCGEGRFCGKWTENPNSDVVSFDNVLWAFNTIFTSITLEGWTSVMYSSMDTVGWWSVFYWVLLIVFGAFILTNLTLAVILTKFRESVEEQEAQKALQLEQAEREARLERLTKEYYEARRRNPNVSVGNINSNGDGPRGPRAKGPLDRRRNISVRSPDAEIRLREASFAGLVSNGTVHSLFAEEREDERSTGGTSSGDTAMVAPARPEALSAVPEGDEEDDGKAVPPRPGAEGDAVAAWAAGAAGPAPGGPAQPGDAAGVGVGGGDGPATTWAMPIPEEELDEDAAHAAALAKAASSAAFARTPAGRSVKLFASQGGEFCEPADEPEPGSDEPSCIGTALAAAWTHLVAFFTWFGVTVLGGAYEAVMHHVFRPTSVVLYPVVTHPVFENLILLCIVANTVTLSIENYGMDDQLRDGLAIANVVFTIIFVVEMVLKLLGLGLWGYFSEWFNRFDGIIVIVSVVDLFVGGDGGIAAFRTVRIARVLKIAKYLDSMRMIAEVVRQSLESFSYIALLLLLFCFIYSVLGMQLFGGIFADRDPADYPRNNFDDLFSAFVTVFQILAGEAWNEIMYEVVGATGQPASAIYFITWVILGQFILLNLFLAVLLDNFSESEAADDAVSSEDSETDSELADLEDKDGSDGIEGMDSQGGLEDGAAFGAGPALEDDGAAVSASRRVLWTRAQNQSPSDGSLGFARAEHSADFASVGGAAAGSRRRHGDATHAAAAAADGSAGRPGRGSDSEEEEEQEQDDDDDDIGNTHDVRVVDNGQGIGTTLPSFSATPRSRRIHGLGNAESRRTDMSGSSELEGAASPRGERAAGAASRFAAPTDRSGLHRPSVASLRARRAMVASQRRLTLAIRACQATTPEPAASAESEVGAATGLRRITGFFGISSRSASPGATSGVDLTAPASVANSSSPGQAGGSAASSAAGTAAPTTVGGPPMAVRGTSTPVGTRPRRTRGMLVAPPASTSDSDTSIADLPAHAQTADHRPSSSQSGAPVAAAPAPARSLKSPPVAPPPLRGAVMSRMAMVSSIAAFAGGSDRAQPSGRHSAGPSADAVGVRGASGSQAGSITSSARSNSRQAKDGHGDRSSVRSGGTSKKAGSVAAGAIFGGNMFSGRGTNTEAAEAQRQLKRRRRVAVRLILRRFRSVWLKVEEGRSSLASYAFKRPYHEAALMALLPPPRPGILYGRANVQLDAAPSAHSLRTPASRAAPAGLTFGELSAEEAAARHVAMSLDDAGSPQRSNSILHAATNIVSPHFGRAERIERATGGSGRSRRASASRSARLDNGSRTATASEAGEGGLDEGGAGPPSPKPARSKRRGRKTHLQQLQEQDELARKQAAAERDAMHRKQAWGGVTDEEAAAAAAAGRARAGSAAVAGTEAGEADDGAEATAQSVARALHAMDEVDGHGLERALSHAIKRERTRLAMPRPTASALVTAADDAGKALTARQPSGAPQAAEAPQGAGAAAAAPGPSGAAGAPRTGAPTSGSGVAMGAMAAAAAVSPARGRMSREASDADAKPPRPPSTHGTRSARLLPSRTSLASPPAANHPPGSVGSDSSSTARLQLPAVWDNETWAVGVNPAAPSMVDIEGIDAEERKRIMLANVIRMWRTKDHPIDRQRRREAALAAARAMGPPGSAPRCTPDEAIARLRPDLAAVGSDDVDFVWETIKARALLAEPTISAAGSKAVSRDLQRKQRMTHVPSMLEAECRSRLLGEATEKDGLAFDSAVDDGDSTTPPAETPDDRKRRVATEEKFADWHGNHLCCFPRHGRVATAARRIVRDQPLCRGVCCGRLVSVSFDSVILFLIILSSVILAAEGPPPEDVPPVGSTAFSVLEIFFTIVFGFEIVLKVVAFGFAFAPGSYLRETWNIIDFVVVLSSVLNLSLSAAAGDSFNLGFLRTLRLLRCLRPLRVIARNQGMRVVVTALLRSVTDIGNVMIVLLLVWLMFAILGVQLFAGKMHSCNDPDFPPATSRFGVRNSTGGWAVEPCSPEFSFTSGDGEVVPREWQPFEPNFDNVMNAMLQLFIMSSGENWPSVMFRCIDTVAVDVSPKVNNSPAAVLFFIAFIVVGSFFFLNLFTGVIFDNFLRLKKEMDSSGILTDGQREWVRRARNLLAVKPERTVVAPHRFRQPVRRFFFDLAQNPLFQTTITVAIILNVCTLAVNFYGEPPLLTTVLEVVNYFFTGLFILEAAIKIFALTLRQYLVDPWNRFDLVVVIGSILDVVFTSLQGFYLGSLLGKIFRIARVLRVIRLAKAITGLRRLIVTLVASVPALVNVGSLLLLLFFIYAIMGVQSFGRVPDGDAMDAHANFRTFSIALLTLFRISTGEGWEGFLFDTQSDGHFVGWIYYVSFVTIASFVMVNLFITIIIEEFETAEAETDGMSDSHLQAFKMVWRYFDPEGLGRLRVRDLEHFLRHLPEPMGIPVDTMVASGASVAALLRKLQDMDLDSHELPGSSDQWVFFHEVLSAVHRTSFKARVPGKVLQDLHIHPINIKRATQHRAVRETVATSAPSRRKGWFSRVTSGMRFAVSGGSKAALEGLTGGRRRVLQVSKIMATVAIRQAFQERIARSRRRAAVRLRREERRQGHLKSIAAEAAANMAAAASGDAPDADSPDAAAAARSPSGLPLHRTSLSAATAGSAALANVDPTALAAPSAEESRRLRLDLRPEDVDAMPPAHLRVLARRIGEPFSASTPPSQLRQALRLSIERAVSSRGGPPSLRFQAHRTRAPLAASPGGSSVLDRLRSTNPRLRAVMDRVRASPRAPPPASSGGSSLNVSALNSGVQSGASSLEPGASSESDAE